MGIPKYFGYLKRKYNIIDKREPKELNVDKLMIDANSLIYDANHEKDMEEGEDEILYEADLIERVIQKIYELIQLVNPKVVTYVAFDGLAPLVKMEQQRMRRFLNRKSSGWNTNKITPGTVFMGKLSTRIKEIETNCLKISGSNERGEGEQKLFKKIREEKREPVVMIHGKDADLIMLCLMHIEYVDEFYIFRDTEIININRLVNYLYREMIPASHPSNETHHHHNQQKQPYYYHQTNNHNNYHRANHESMNILENREDKISKMKDYVFISNMKGNDFIEPIIMCEEEIMLRCYRTVGKTIIEGDDIRMDIFLEMVKLMSDEEEEVMVRIRRERERQSKRSEKKIERLPIILRGMKLEKEVREGEEGWKERYEKLMEEERGYKGHMKWINNYNKGKEVKIRRKRGKIGPLMRKLLLLEEGSSSSEEEMDEKDQLVYVLPKEDKEILKEAGIEISKINEEIYVKEKEYECAYKTNIWEGKAGNMPKIRKRGEKEGEYNMYSRG